MTLAAVRSIDGAPFQDDEVTDLEIDAPIDSTLTEAPPGCRGGSGVAGVSHARGDRRRRGGSRAGTDVAAGRVLLPERRRLRQQRRAPGVAERSRGTDAEFISLFEWPESQPRGEDGYVWERVERGSRTVLISDVSDRVGERGPRRSPSRARG